MVTINLGNIWDMLSAIGTIAAVVVSLYLAHKESGKHLKVTGGYDVSFSEYPTMMVSKNGYDQFTLVEVGYCRFGKHQLANEDFYIADKDGRKQVADEFPYSFTNENLIHIVFYNEKTSIPFDTRIQFYVKDLEGKTYKSKSITIRKMSR